ncbi:MAG TPA: SRPBCC domain-containing protein [Candidatus Angelobacter sp.]|nr:SRPBCC domain-containing protein [Candidatus Angelobacter sp.]
MVLKATPTQIYAALVDAKQFSKITGGAPTEISSDAGGVFSCFGGMITGRQIELVPNQRIVQAWRAGNWEAGLYSIVRFELREQGSGTKLLLDHVGFPEGAADHLEAGWKANYFEPLEKYLA